MTSKPAVPNPTMADPADKNVHSGERKKSNSADDLVDPTETDPDAPHDRGVVRDCNFEGAREDMVEHVGKDKDAWKKGQTQNT